MKIGFFADGPWAHEALRKILELDDIEIAFVVARYENPDAYLKNWADETGTAFYTPQKVNSAEFLAEIDGYKADLLVSMSYNQIFKSEICKAAPLGFINCHAGALPFYRGRNVLNWALINGEKQIGVTVHYIDEGIDTGDIIVQEFVDVAINDNYGDVLEKVYPVCAEALVKALQLIAVGTDVPRIEQSTIHPSGSYFGMRIEGDENLDWSWSSTKLHNFIRAISLPAPGARCLYKEQEVAILSSRLLEGAVEHLGQNGQIVGRNSDGIIVKTEDTSILVTQIANVNENGGLDEPYFPDMPLGSRFSNKS